MVNKKQYDRIKKVRGRLTDFIDKLHERTTTPETIVELMAQRNYESMEIYELLDKQKVTKIKSLSDIELIMPEFTMDDFRDFGILTSKGEYLLAERWVLPIRDIQGQVIALVGWKPFAGAKKYITTPTVGFSRDTSFFMMDNYKEIMEKHNGVVYVVEGIFGAVSLTSIGLPAIALQGLELSKIKSYMLTRFNLAIFIPDPDKPGISTIPILAEMSGYSSVTKHKWKTSAEHIYTRLTNTSYDIDDIVHRYDCYNELYEIRNKKFLYKLDVSKLTEVEKEVV